jgi:hypothetical protein
VSPNLNHNEPLPFRYPLQLYYTLTEAFPSTFFLQLSHALPIQMIPEFVGEEVLRNGLCVGEALQGVHVEGRGGGGLAGK